jgi:hypothetical protein
MKGEVAVPCQSERPIGTPNRHPRTHRYRVEPSQTKRAELRALLSGARHAARKLKRARIFLDADAGASAAAHGRPPGF